MFDDSCEGGGVDIGASPALAPSPNTKTTTQPRSRSVVSVRTCIYCVYSTLLANFICSI